MVLGYLAGYLVIGTVLMPLYYRLNLVSIYTYLESRFGFWSYKTGAFFFLLSRVIGASFRLFLVAGVLQLVIFDTWGVPFWVSVLITILLIWVYTFKGGIKTIVWTDTLQTFFMLAAVVITIYLIGSELEISAKTMAVKVWNSDYSKVFFWDWKGSNFFFKQFIAGAFIAIVMTGLDQDMMQKNLTCRNIGEAQKNMFWFSIVLVFVNILFLILGALLYIFAAERGIEIPVRADDLYPLLALNHFNLIAAIVFMLGLTAAAYSSADSALTALTTSFCVDFLNFDKFTEKKKRAIRIRVHLLFSLLLFLTILIFRAINNESVISEVFKAAGYTYGPLLGMFGVGLFTKIEIKDRFVWIICLLAPLLSFLINEISPVLFGGYQIGFEILIINGLLTAIGLFLIIKRKK
jgi:Na+/proline symporter